MGKKWDASGIAYNTELWKECLRVLKPGGHLLAFSGTRTYHRMAVAIEDAGFEVRDMLEWIYASGFPKSLNVSKAIDRSFGEVGKVVGKRDLFHDGSIRKYENLKDDNGGNAQFGYDHVFNHPKEGIRGLVDIIEPSTKEAKQWEGFGTALKPAHEPIILARRPLSEKTIVENVLKHGTGAIDIDGCRIPTRELTPRDNKIRQEQNIYGMGKGIPQTYLEPNEQGRFPANVCVSQRIDIAINDLLEAKSILLDKWQYPSV